MYFTQTPFKNVKMFKQCGVSGACLIETTMPGNTKKAKETTPEP